MGSSRKQSPRKKADQSRPATVMVPATMEKVPSAERKWSFKSFMAGAASTLAFLIYCFTLKEKVAPYIPNLDIIYAGGMVVDQDLPAKFVVTNLSKVKVKNIRTGYEIVQWIDDKGGIETASTFERVPPFDLPPNGSKAITVNRIVTNFSTKERRLPQTISGKVVFHLSFHRIFSRQTNNVGLVLFRGADGSLKSIKTLE